jgi:phosphohistidine phosphatase SixA
MRCLPQIVVCVGVLLSLIGTSRVGAGESAEADALHALREGGCYLLVRHMRTEPGVGDPPDFDVSDRSTQRNLSEQGRHDARRAGEWLREQGVELSAARSSPWYRCRDSADLMVGSHEIDDRLASNFRAPRDAARARTEALRKLLAEPVAQGNVLLMTHQVNILDAVDVNLAMGQGVVVRPTEAGWGVVGTIDLVASASRQ